MDAHVQLHVSLTWDELSQRQEVFDAMGTKDTWGLVPLLEGNIPGIFRNYRKTLLYMNVRRVIISHTGEIF